MDTDDEASSVDMTPLLTPTRDSGKPSILSLQEGLTREEGVSSVDRTPLSATKKAPGELPSLSLQEEGLTRDKRALRVLKRLQTDNPRVSLGRLEYEGLLSPKTIATLEVWLATLSDALKGRGGVEE